MEYILNSGTEGIDLNAYAAYVESIRHRLPAFLHAFASDERYFNLTSPSSLHDAWLESVTVREVATGDRSEIRRREVLLSLLGPLHDRRIHFLYTGVTGYSLVAPAEPDGSGVELMEHGDLFTHEIRLGVGQGFIHEILFEHGASLLIEFRNMEHREEIVAQAS